MNMKKLVALLLALVMVFALCACGGDKDNGGKDSATYKVAMITDYGDITDQSFNQTTYEACKAFAEDNSIEFNYFKPVGDNTDADLPQRSDDFGRRPARRNCPHQFLPSLRAAFHR